ncbi:MAG: hypothetical protein IJP31_11150 [Lachnospiraceae bacterium]|nr:hypothetical protein [Lachnospiraceae bacterium]
MNSLFLLIILFCCQGSFFGCRECRENDDRSGRCDRDDRRRDISWGRNDRRGNNSCDCDDRWKSNSCDRDDRCGNNSCDQDDRRGSNAFDRDDRRGGSACPPPPPMARAQFPYMENERTCGCEEQ